MRTKFKAWHKHLKNIYDVYAIFWDEGIVYCKSSESTTHTFGLKDVELLEYTGVHDDDNKKVQQLFEGDIIEFVNEGATVVGEIQRCGPAFLITYFILIDGHPIDEFIWITDLMESDVDHHWIPKSKKLGNIYKNPELLYPELLEGS